MTILPLAGKLIRPPKITNCEVFNNEGPVPCKCNSLNFSPIEFIVLDTDTIQSLKGLLKCKKCGADLKIEPEDHMSLSLKIKWTDKSTATVTL